MGEGGPPPEAFGVLVVGLIGGDASLLEDLEVPVRVQVGGPQVTDSAVVVNGVVPFEEGVAPLVRGVRALETVGVVGAVFAGYETTLCVGVSLLTRGRL